MIGSTTKEGPQGRSLFLFPEANSTMPSSPDCRKYQFHAIINGMRTTIDAAGRIVVPKSLRDALGLDPGQELEIRAEDGRLEIEAAPTTVRLKKRGKGVVAVPETDLPPLTAGEVRETLEKVRR
jgi:AbrB family looped-hinge helix DNA binding protein